MFLFKVMVCFLAVFRSEDCVGGLPSFQDSPDDLTLGQSVGSASNQRIANEPGSRAPQLLDYAERHESEVPRTPSASISQKPEPFVLEDGGTNPNRNPGVPDKSESTDYETTSSPGTNETLSLPSHWRNSEPGEKSPESRKNVEVNSERYASLVAARGIPGPQDEAPMTALENRARKRLGNVEASHQQSTNMRPTRTQHLVGNKRSPAEGNVLKLPGYGGRRMGLMNRRAFAEGPGGSLESGNHLRFTGVNPVQINAASAYGRSRSQGPQLDLSRALYQFGPAQLHALRGVFDTGPPPTQNFRPIAPKQVVYAPPRIIYDAKIEPTPFMPFNTEQKTVDALSALLGQSPGRQLEGLSLILGKDRPEAPKQGLVREGPGHNDIRDSVALSQAFVTPIPSADINSGLVDGSIRFDNHAYDHGQGVGSHVQEEEVLQHPVVTGHDRGVTDVGLREDRYKTIPIVEEIEETQVKEEERTVWKGAPVKGKEEDEGRYRHHEEEDREHGEGYAAKYNFGYHVKDYESGNDFGHQEVRDGVVTNGRYHVLLPDGRIQNVKYHVDEGGYHAKVSYQLHQDSN